MGLVSLIGKHQFNMPTSEGISLASAFTALPDIDDIAAGCQFSALLVDA